MITSVKVEVGQVWQDNDKRMFRRLLRVSRIDGDYCWLQGRGPSGWTLRETRVKLSRMRPTATGYRLVEKAQ